MEQVNKNRLTTVNGWLTNDGQKVLLLVSPTLGYVILTDGPVKIRGRNGHVWDEQLCQSIVFASDNLTEWRVTSRSPQVEAAMLCPHSMLMNVFYNHAIQSILNLRETNEEARVDEW